jgi:hypothetical protein
MPETLIERAPQVRCYICGSTDIFSVCHHCQQPMCGQHSPPAYLESGKPVATPAGSGDGARPVSREFAGLKLGGTREAVYHCDEHAHVVRGLSRFVVIGAAAAVLGVIVLLFAPLPGVLLLLIGIVTAGVPLGLRMLRERDADASVPPLPLVPHVNSVDVVESVTGHVRLDQKYESQAGTVAGEIKVNMSSGDGRRVLQLYRKKHRLAGGRPVRFSAGFLMVRGKAGLEFLPDQPAVLRDRAGLSLGGDSVDGHDLFPADPQVGQGEWTLKAGYELQHDRVPTAIPLWIVPSLVPASGRRALEIDLHWNRLGPEGHELNLQMFDRIQLEVPASWGNVESSDPERVEVSRSGGRRTITWQRLRPGADQGRTATDAGRSLALKLRFERAINEEAEPSDDGTDDSSWPADGQNKRKLTLSGTVEATFGGTLSGLTGVGVYLPGGGPGYEPDVKPQTKVGLTFDVSLRALRYQDNRVIPDENNPEDRREARNKPDEFVGVVPDYRTVAELTNSISADDYYIKSVVEHPPYSDDGRPDILNRVWDISGRRYDGVFPVDFEISLQGEEVGPGVSSAFSGKTVAQVTVKGAHAKGIVSEPGNDAESVNDAVTGSEHPGAEDDAGDELLQRIEDTWIALRETVRRVLRGRAFVDGSPALAAVPDDVVLGEVVEEGEETDSEAVVDGDVVEEATTVSGAEAKAARAEDLRRQRQAAEDAFRRQWIPEQNYREIVADIAAELRELEESS